MSTENMTDLMDKIEQQGFESQAGLLINFQPWVELKELADSDLDDIIEEEAAGQNGQSEGDTKPMETTTPEITPPITNPETPNPEGQPTSNPSDSNAGQSGGQGGETPTGGSLLYYGTKKVNAKPMTRQQYNDLRGWTLPANENGADEGYLVEYLDGGTPNVEGFEGYVSWSPKEQFEKAYQPFGALSFGHAIVALKAGNKLARSGWNGKDMFIYYVPANSYPAQTDAARSVFGDMVPYGAYLAMKTAQGNVVPWLASQTDMLADDWQVVG